ncbi:uncharacterized protein LOC133318462 isoform X2 [Gastrolobium bilobum]|uniref:uncharacterized protein LOC133318462 isoform X2 n=1 Tax=Gastrolobium bilobum TaxID=150636 RepID=UPI002AB11035|nr:uncharacterized protein LOC133318462 isoform X2 [Gastrolobium bilobum]
MAEPETMLIVADEKSHRRSRAMQFPTLAIIDGIFSRKSFFYDRLPPQPFRLSVLKLDGSCFDIQVSKTSTIAELKDAVEAVFSHVPQKGPGTISWPHVWGQFCLSYDGQKLVIEKDYLRDYGIKDGDQLRFIRHVSNSWGIQRKRMKKRVVHLKQHRRSSQVNSYQPKGNCDDDEIGCDDDEAIENGNIEHCIKEEERVGKNKLTGFLGDLFSYTPLTVVRKSRTKRIYSSMIPRCLLSSFRKIRRIVCFGRRRHYPWRQH